MESDDGVLPREVLSFLDRYITSVDQLEILLFMRERRSSWWSPAQVSAELRSSEMAVEQRLTTLGTMGFVERDAERRFRYAPTDPAAEATVSRLAGLYADFRLRIIERIFRKPTGLAAFADAFRLRPEKD